MAKKPSAFVWWNHHNIIAQMGRTIIRQQHCIMFFFLTVVTKTELNMINNWYQHKTMNFLNPYTPNQYGATELEPLSWSIFSIAWLIYEHLLHYLNLLHQVFKQFCNWEANKNLSKSIEMASSSLKLSLFNWTTQLELDDGIKKKLKK